VPGAGEAVEQEGTERTEAREYGFCHLLATAVQPIPGAAVRVFKGHEVPKPGGPSTSTPRRLVSILRSEMSSSISDI